jgi:hypothetical protein
MCLFWGVIGCHLVLAYRYNLLISLAITHIGRLFTRWKPQVQILQRPQNSGMKTVSWRATSDWPF